jgi:hypothetical protein
MRLGAGFSHGRYEPGTPPAGPVDGQSTATVINLEGEYAIRYTRLSGEWVRDRFDTPAGVTTARGFNVQAVQTLTPRLFAAARVTRVRAPTATTPSVLHLSSAEIEATLGYRLTTEVTLRGGYQRQRGYRDTAWGGAAVVSLVWAERWW